MVDRRFARKFHFLNLRYLAQFSLGQKGHSPEITSEFVLGIYLSDGACAVALLLPAEAECLMQRLHGPFHSARFHKERNVVFGRALRNGDDIDRFLAQRAKYAP